MSHRNWFLTLVEKYIIAIVWTSLLVSVSLTAATYLVEPVYSVKTELSLDASVDKILPDINGTPSTSATDYIRQEYFAINSVNLMQKPEIGQKIIFDYGLTDNKGNKLTINNFINPSPFGLIFSTNGQGITVKWISDTQQFSITGYGKDINTAALLSSRYADAFVSYDKKQFKNILENLKERQTIILTTATSKLLTVEKEQAALRKEYGVADWAGRLESLTTSLASAEQNIYSEELAESTTRQRLGELEKQVKDLKQTNHWTVIEKKSEKLTTLQNSLTRLTQELAAATVEFTPKHPEIKKIEKQIDSVNRQIKNETKMEFSQSIRNTSDALDTVLTTLMQTREEQVVRKVTLAKLTALKKQLLKELNSVGSGDALYNNLEQKKSGLSVIERTANQNIIEIEALIKQPFSFFRIIAQPFVDNDNIKDFKYLPQRKLTLILSFISVFLLSLFYIVIRELHLETLFYGWQLRQLPNGIESIDIVCKGKKGRPSSASRLIFHSPAASGKLIRIRRLDSKSNPNYIAKLGAEYFFLGGESTLLVNNRQKKLDQECPDGEGLRSWLTGHMEEATAGIQQNNKRYDILCDAHWNPDEPWIKSMEEIEKFFLSLSEQYNNVILIDPALHNDTRLPGDVLAPDIDILTVNGGSLSVSQTLETVQHEKQTFKGGKIVILVINNKESINLFSIKGCFLLLSRFLKAPFEIIIQK